MTLLQTIGDFVGKGTALFEKYIIEIVIGVGVVCLIAGYLIFIKGRGL